MRIEAVKAFMLNKPSAAKNPAAQKQNTVSYKNSYNLPGYNLSFGMSKAKINYGYIQVSDIDKKAEIQEAVEIAANADDDMDILEGLVQKYSDDKDALKYIFELSDIQNNEDGENFIAAYLCALKNNSVDNNWNRGEWNEFMTELLCVSKNQKGQTIPQIFASNAPVMDVIFSATDNHPDVLYAILTNTDSNGSSIGTKAAYSGNGSIFKLLNEKLYYLAWHDRSLSLSDAIYLLDTNKDILDKTNKKLLDSLVGT